MRPNRNAPSKALVEPIWVLENPADFSRHVNPGLDYAINGLLRW